MHYIPDFTPKDNDYKWVIISPREEKVIGYFAYYIDGVVDSVYNFGLYSFERNPVVGYCVYNKMLELIKNHRRIEWRMIAGNPVEKHYDKICKQFGGNKITLHNVIKDTSGQYVDEYIYEIVKNE